MSSGSRPTSLAIVFISRSESLCDRSRCDGDSADRSDAFARINANSSSE
jgi:hypothetical protein